MEEFHSKSVNHLGLIAGSFDELGIAEIINESLPSKGKRKVSYAQAVKAMILNGLGFTSRALYLCPQFFKDKPTQALIGEEILPEHLNDDALGDTLDAIYEVGPTALYHRIASHAVKNLGLQPKFCHGDSTSFHVDGKYDKVEEENVIRITRGYSRDHHPELNQVVLHLINEQSSGIPLHMESVSGNQADKETFRNAVESHISQLQNDHQFSYLCYDSEFYNEKTLKAFPQGLFFISRVPETSSSTKEAIRCSFGSSWKTLDENYSYIELCSTTGGHAQRCLLFHSTQARTRAEKTVQKQIKKTGEKEVKALEQLCRREFRCELDAKQEIQRFKASTKVIEFSSVSISSKKFYEGRGKPKEGSKVKRIGYFIQASVFTALETYNKALHQKSCFILATNQLDEAELSAKEVLKNYKGQNAVEKSFRFLKNPWFMCSSLYLKNPKRIMALMMVMTVCLLVYASFEWKLRNQLETQNEEVEDQKGKPTKKPTTRWIYQCFEGIHLLYINDKEPIILNLNEFHKKIVRLMGKAYQPYYPTIEYSKKKGS